MASAPARGRLQGKVALITGTAGGQGRAAALAFAREGALVVGCDVKEAESRETVAMVRAAGGTMTSMEPVDLGDSATARAWIDEAAAVHGGIDVLYNNASAARFQPFAQTTDDDWHFSVRNELDLVFHACSRARPHLRLQRGVAAPRRPRRRRDHHRRIDLGHELAARDAGELRARRGEGRGDRH